MNMEAKAILYVFSYLLSLAVVILVLLYLFRREYIDHLSDSGREVRNRSRRRGQVRRAAKKAGMSFREYSIKHFS